MFNILMESIQIYLNSHDGDKIITPISDVEYYIPQIEIPDGFHIYISVQNMTIPYSFYNIKNSNNLLSYSFYEIPQTIINVKFINGNYNITQIVDYLNNAMVGFTISYNSITNKLTFDNDNQFILLKSSTCLDFIGFTHKNHISKSLTSDNCVNIMGIKKINISSNFISYNINKSAINDYSILCSVPVNKPPYSLIEYNNNNHFRTNLFVSILSLIRIKLTDEHEHLIDFNGCHYSLTLQIDIEPFK